MCKKSHIGGGIKHKLASLILGLAVAVSGWIVPEIPVYATTYSPSITATISGGYLYIPASACPTLYKVYNAAQWINSSDGGYYSREPGWYEVFEADSYGTEARFDTGMRGFKTYTFLYSYYDDEDDITISRYNYTCFIINGSPVVDGNYLRYPLRGMITSEQWFPYFYYNTISTSGYPSSVNLYADVTTASSSKHNFSSTASAATCTSPATKKCSKCGATVPDGNALGHSPGAAATCTTPQKCTRSGCGAIIQNALGHDWGSGNGSITQNQSCTLPEIRYNKCTRCTATNGTKQTKAALGHDWQTATLSNNNGVKIQPDVYTDATYYQKCSRCSTGHSGDYYTSHYNVVPNTKLNFQIYSGGNRINKIYIGSTLIMNSSAGTDALVK